MKILILLLLLVFTGCDAQSKLPKEMPSDVRFGFSENGGMSPYFTNIEIEGSTLKYKAKLPNNEQKVIEWTAKISIEDKENLYKLFVENKFDTIKNEKRKEIVYDAGSEGVNLSFSPNNSFSVSYGPNSPLSDKNQKRYKIVADEIGRLAKKYEATKQ